MSSSDLELAQMIKAQGQDILSGHRKSLCIVLGSNHFFITIYGLDKNYALFSILVLAQMTLNKVMARHQQSLCEVGTYSVFP